MDSIRDVVIEDRGVNCWISRMLIIWDQLKKLMPGIPIDGDIGKIAFNVPNKNRMKIKTGKFLIRKLNLNNGFLTDQQLQKIGGSINKELFPDIGTQLVCGEKITDNYENEIGGQSCMTGSCAEYTKLYEDNPDKFQMLTMHYMSDSARAIVHTFDNGEKMMDRVYASSEQLKSAMKDYARDHNWHVGYGCDDPDSTWNISELNYTEGEIPYMDTMVYGRINHHDKLDLSAYSSRGYDIDMQTTDGTLERNSICCCSCGENICEDEQRSIDEGDVYCNDCFNEAYSYCEYCEDYCAADSITHIEDRDIWVCNYCADHHYYRCEHCSDYFSTVTHIEDEDYDVCESCIDDYSYCEDCGTCNKNMTFIKSEDRDVCDENCLCNYHICKECGDYFDDVSSDDLCEDCENDVVPIPVSCKIGDTGNLFNDGEI